MPPPQLAEAEPAATDVPRGAEGEAACDAAYEALPGSGPCPLCDGGLRPWLSIPGDWRRPAALDSFRLGWCDACRYGLLVPRPTPAAAQAFYRLDDYYTHHAPRETAGGAAWLDRLRVALAWRCDQGVEAEIDAAALARHAIYPPRRLCDVGCGNGGLLRRLSAAGFEVAGIEPDPDACRTAQAGGLRVLCGSGEGLPPELAGERFDVVTMGHVLEHCLDPLAAVRNVAGLLVEGGHFVVETPNNEALGLRRAGAAWHWLDVPRHVNFFTAASLQTVCRRAGLSIVAVEFTGYTRQFQTPWIAEEQRIHDRLSHLAERSGDDRQDGPPANSAWRALRLLAATWRAPAERKYDSVRVVARRDPAR